MSRRGKKNRSVALPRLFLLAPILFLWAGTGWAEGPRIVQALVSLPLRGPPSSPQADGPEEYLSISARDAKGRLVLVGWPDEGGATAGTVQGGDAQTTASSPAERGGAGSETGNPWGLPSANSVDKLKMYDLSWSGRGFVSSIAQHVGTGPAESETRWLRDGEGRLIRLELREKAALAATLDLSWNGRGDEAVLVLRDQSGKAIQGGDLLVGEAGLSGRAVSLSLVDGSGADDGSLQFAWDAEGRLSRWNRRAAPTAVAMGMEGPTQKTDSSRIAGASSGPGGPSGSSESRKAQVNMDIERLLFPFWPHDALSFELFEDLSPFGVSPVPHRVHDAGPVLLTFDRPEDGHVDFLWEGPGRLSEARAFTKDGEVLASLNCRYDARGLLVEEDSTKVKKKAESLAGRESPDSAAAVPSEGAVPTRERVSWLLTYRLDRSGAWTACSLFSRVEGPGALSPLAMVVRQSRILGADEPAGSAAASP